MEFKSYAKVNLYLEVLNRREDSYHNISTLFSCISLHDTIRIKSISSVSSLGSVFGRISFKCFSEDGVLSSSRENIVWEAIKSLSPYIRGLDGGLEIELIKNIPLGAGLGGGSSNAACVLVGLNEYLGLGFSLSRLEDISSLLGADVAFFIRGGLAEGEARGDKLSFYNFPYFFYIVIVYPGINLSTKSAYTAWKPGAERGGFVEGVEKRAEENRKRRAKEQIANITKVLRGKDLTMLSRYMYNSFEEVQFKLYPFLREIKEVFLKMGADASLMSGSGSSIFAIFSSVNAARRSYELMKGRYDKVFLETSRGTSRGAS